MSWKNEADYTNYSPLNKEKRRIIASGTFNASMGVSALTSRRVHNHHPIRNTTLSPVRTIGGKPKIPFIRSTSRFVCRSNVRRI